MNRIEPFVTQSLQPAKRPAQLPKQPVSSASISNRATSDFWGLLPQARGLQSIAVLLDGSQGAEHALPHAIQIARQTGASLRIVRAYSHLEDIEPWQFSQAAAQIKTGRRERQEYLARIAGRVEQLSSLRPETVLINHADSIAAFAQGALGGDLVIVGSQQKRFASQFWWLNQVDQLRRRIQAPLLLTPHSRAPADLTVEPRLERILVPLDGSVRSQSIVDHAALLSRACGSKVALLNVQDALWSLGYFEHTTPRGHLLSIRQQLLARGVSAEAEILTTSANIGRSIAEYSHMQSVDLIAIATHGDAGLQRWLRGSVADYLLRNTSIPILLRNVPQVQVRSELTRIA